MTTDEMNLLTPEQRYNEVLITLDQMKWLAKQIYNRKNTELHRENMKHENNELQSLLLKL